MAFVLYLLAATLFLLIILVVLVLAFALCSRRDAASRRDAHDLATIKEQIEFPSE